MLDTDETAGFDEAVSEDPELRAAWQEMNRMTAAVAVAIAVPVKPRAGQLERLHLRLGLATPRSSRNWAAISGWAAAAVLALLLARPHVFPHRETVTVTKSGDPVVAGESSVPEELLIDPERDNPLPLPESPGTGTHDIAIATPDVDGKASTRAETKRLIQKIEVLRGQLEGLERRDRKRFTPIAGMAWPIVMRMMPPATLVPPGDVPSEIGTPAITTMLGDALMASNLAADPTASLARQPSATPLNLPSAVPVYDAARDEGTLVINSLPQARGGETYNLWVVPEEGGSPVHVGSLPDSEATGADSFDFKLGSTGVVPSGFILTKDPAETVKAPSAGNTVLQGPR